MQNINRLLIISVLALPMLGFGSCQPKVTTPKEVYITVEKLPELTDKQKKALADCPIAVPKNTTVEESIRINRLRRTSLANCNVDKKEIRSWFEMP